MGDLSAIYNSFLFTDEQREALRKNRASPERMQRAVDKANESSQIMQQQDLREGQFGSTAGHFLRGLTTSRSKKVDEKGNAVVDENGNPVYNEDAMTDSTGGAIAAWAIDALGQNAQNFVGLIPGMDFRGNGWAAKSAQAANVAGAFADAQNDKARKAIMGDAERQADYMNLQNSQTTAAMTDAAIGQANAYESGMQGIGMSGIEGSENMERNLKYGQSRADAQEQLQYDLMGMRADDMESSMVNSFDRLSEQKAGAMQQAWSGAMGGINNGLTQDRIAAGQASLQAAPSLNDIQGTDRDPAAAADETDAAADETDAAAANNAAAAAAQTPATQTPAAPPQAQTPPPQTPAAPQTQTPAAPPQAQQTQTPQAPAQAADYSAMAQALQTGTNSANLAALAKQAGIPQDKIDLIQNLTNSQQWKTNPKFARYKGSAAGKQQFIADVISGKIGV